MRRFSPLALMRMRFGLFLVALVVAAYVGLATGLRDQAGLARSLGDTDDAMRLVLVRALLNGQGFWDQNVVRLQPPHGVFMHWSRLLDAAIALFEGALRLVVPGERAEWLTRLLWPLLWLVPAAYAALLVSKRLGERAGPDGAATLEGEERAALAAIVCVLLLATNFTLYLQFRPGRVDHHDVQMTLFLLAFAGAAARRRSVAGGVLAGVASGLGLAIGLEALAFDALIGICLALFWARTPARAPGLIAYGLALAASALAFDLVQTPPWRWGVLACDALALNSAGALAVAGLGLAAAAALSSRRGAAVRLGALALAGAAAGLVYAGLDPRCLKGPFADVDPAIKSFWLAHVLEMRPWLVVLRDNPDDAIHLGTPPIMAALALIGLLVFSPPARRDPPLLLAGVLLLAAAAAGFSGVRMGGYADWVAMPILAAAAAALGQAAAARFKRPALLTTLFAALLINPGSIANLLIAARAGLAAAVSKGPSPVKKKEAPDRCFEAASFRPLAAAPPGLVAAEIDLGPFILAHTKDSALAAPYHRMSWGLLEARGALGAPADGGAEARARALGVAYVLECRAHRRHADRDGLSANSLQRRLDRGDPPPSWLEALTPASAPIEVFRVRPVSAPPATPIGAAR
jgi:hypothetical protein